MSFGSGFGGFGQSTQQTSNPFGGFGQNNQNQNQNTGGTPPTLTLRRRSGITPLPTSSATSTQLDGMGTKTDNIFGTGFGSTTNTGFGATNNNTNAGGSLFGGGGNTGNTGGFGSGGESHSQSRILEAQVSRYLFHAVPFPLFIHLLPVL